MTIHIKALLFDFGNVLVKWDVHRIYDAYFPAPADVDAFLEEVHFYEWNSHMDRGLSFAEGVAQASAEFPQYARLFRLFDDQWLETVREPIEGSIAIARRLKGAGHPLYLLSNISKEKFPQARREHNFLSMFEDCILSSELGVIKPEPAIFEQTLQRIHQRTEDVIFIDDAQANVEAASRLGIASICFETPEQLERKLKKINVL
jgi:2-haloacid dehalogenase